MRFRNALTEHSVLRGRVLASACLLLLAVAMIGCDSSEDKESSISGTVTIPAGATGTVENTRVALYTSRDDWNNDAFLRTVAADANGNYTFEDVPPGVYFVDAWKDNNNDNVVSLSDFFGVFGACTLNGCTVDPIEILEGDSKTGNISMAVI